MATSVSEIAATTWEYREKKPSDLVADNVPFLFKLREKGRIQTISGGRVIWEDTAFAQNNYVQSIDPAEEIALGYNQTLTAFEYSPKITVVPVVINALEKAQNQGEGSFKDLLKERLDVADKSLQNKFESMLQGDGTGTGGKDFAGIKAYISKTPTLGTVGGISRVSYSVIRNGAYTAASFGGTATSASNIESRIRYIKNTLVRNTERPSLLLCGSDNFNFIGDAMAAKQRLVQDSEMAKAGFDTIVVEGLTAVLANGKTFSGLSRIAANEMYFVNPEAFSLKMYKGYNMQPLPERVSVNQLVDVSITCAIGNLTCNNPAICAVFSES